MRALSSGDLRAQRDNRGRWQITPEALDDWASLRRIPDRQSPDQTDGPPAITMMDTPETIARLAVAEARLSDVSAERDRLVRLLDQALQRRPSIIDRLLGR